MSKINKLSIKGIRNFDDVRESTPIRFSRPLTLILGPNGTGKTTIIECLRYALSGEYPPGANSGKAFVHDPTLKKLAAGTVRANVKLEVTDIRGDRVTVSRILEAERVKQNDIKCKTLDSAISRVNKKTGEKSGLNGTCAAVDIEMLSSMGVSKAILNYVLFCHQDDANWPFEAGKNLKERFDEIFDTTRYNKALDTIRAIVKEKRASLKVLQAEQRGLLMVVDEVKSKRRKLKDYETRRNEAQQKINDLTNKLKPINERLSELKEIETEYCKWQIEEEKKKMEYKLLRRQIESLRDEIKELYKGTTAELRNEIISYEEMLTEKNNQIAQLEQELQERSVKEAKMSNLIAERRVAVGTLRQQLQDQNAKITQRNETLRAMITSWGLKDTIDPDVTENEAEELRKKLEQKLRQLEQEVESRRIQQDQEIEEHQRKLNTLRSERTTTQSQLENSRRELQNVRAEIRTNTALLKQSGAMEQKLNEVDTRLAEANEQFERVSESTEIESLKRRLNEATREEEKNERGCNLIDKEINLLREQSSLQMKLDSANAELAEKMREMESLSEKHGDTLEMLLGRRDLPAGTMMDTINEIQAVLNERIRNLRNEIDTVQYEATKLETSLKHKKEELEKKTAEVQRDKAKVSSHCGEYENYREALLLSSKKVKDIEDKRGMYAYQGAAYKEYIKELSEPSSCCPLCHRGFEDTRDAEELVTEMRRDMTGHPERLKNCEKELASQRRRYDTLLQLQPIVEKIEHFENVDVTRMKREIEESTKNLSMARQKVKRLQDSLVEPERKLSVCKGMIGDMALWDRCSNDNETINSSIDEMQARLRNAGLKSDKTIQEAQKEQSDMQQLLKDTRREIKSLQCELDSRNEELRRVTERRTKLLEEQLRLHKELQDIKQAKEALETLRSKEATIEKKVQSFDERLIEVGEQCEAADESLERAKKKIRALQDADRSTIREHGKELDKLNTVANEVKNFLSRKIDEQLKSVEEKLDSAERHANRFKNERTARENELAKVKQDVAAHDTRKRDLSDNLTMRRKENDAEKLKVECTALRDKLMGTNYDTVSKERKTLCERRDVTERERNIAQGNEEELERNVAQLNVELQKSEYRSAQSNYKEKCVELAVTQLCVKDLLMYCKVLDYGMIEYHEERMSTVNKSMKKLWDLIYTGTDTTSIQIRTEATTNTTEKRQYNYKLVQIKHGIEMDMKGRCSAGQRVLASIILRLALAETFCEKCGVLALDEPTTNLDEDNAKSLAEALHSYVNRRAKFQKNFQLIVITHDDNFIPKLGQLSRNNSYYQLYRYDSGMSGIRCVSLDGVTGGTSRDSDNGSSEDENEGAERTKRRPSDSSDRPDRKRARKRHVFE